MSFKGFILFSIILGICKGETCKCFSYVISKDGLSDENKISELEYELENSKCDGEGLLECKNFCIEMYQDLTDNGDLCKTFPEQDRKVAEWLCEELDRDVCNVRVGVFAQNCNTDPIIDTVFRFRDTLCCKNGLATLC